MGSGGGGEEEAGREGGGGVGEIMEASGIGMSSSDSSLADSKNAVECGQASSLKMGALVMETW